MSQLKLWSFEKNIPLDTFQCDKGGVFCMDADFDSNRLLCGAGKNIQLWNLKDRTTIADDGHNVKKASCLKRLEGHQQQVNGLVADWAKKLVVSGSNDKTLRRWNFETGELLQVFGASDTEILCLGGSLCDRRVISGDVNGLKVWDPLAGECVRTLTGHSDAVISISTTRTHFVLSGSRDGTVKCWDLRDGTCVRTLAAGDGEKIWVIGVRAQPMGFREEGSRDGARSGGGSTIRVANVPRDLSKRDIIDAFEDTGKVHSVQVDRGVAWITYGNPLDAKKAVQTFDRKELNGQTLFVTVESL